MSIRTGALATGLAALTALAGVAGLVAAVPAPAAAVPAPTGYQGASAVYQQAMATAKEQHSVHYVIRSSGGGATGVTVGDAGPGRGTLSVMLSDGTTTGHLRVEVAGAAAYLRGDRTALVDLGFASAKAAKAAGHWLSVPATDTAYATVSGGATFDSALAELAMAGPFTLGGSSRQAGVAVTTVRARYQRSGTTAPVSFYVAKAGQHLPEGYRVSATDHKTTTTATVTLSRWNEKVSVVVPAHSTPITAYSTGHG